MVELFSLLFFIDDFLHSKIRNSTMILFFRIDKFEIICKTLA